MSEPQINQRPGNRAKWPWVVLGMILTWYLFRAVWLPLGAHRNDFGHMYIGGAIAARGGDVYDIKLAQPAARQFGVPRLNPFVYPPFMAVCMVPLSWFTYSGAWLLWSLVSHGLALASGEFLRRIWSRSQENSTSASIPFFGSIWILGLSLFHPWIRSIEAGQFNAVMLFGLVLALYWLMDRQDTYAGIALGLLAGLKVTPLLLLLWLIPWQRPKAALAGLSTFGATVVVGFLWLGPAQTWEFASIARQMGYGSSTWSDVGMYFHVEPANQAPSAVWYRLFTENPWTRPVIDSPWLAYGLSLLTAAVVFGAVVFGTVAGSTWGQWSPRAYLLGIGSILLLPSLCWDHYLVQWLPAVYLLGLESRSWRWSRKVIFWAAVFLMAIGFDTQWAAYVKWAWPDISWIDSAIRSLLWMDYASDHWKQGLGILIPSHKLLGLILTFVLLLRQPAGLDHPESASA